MRGRSDGDFTAGVQLADHRTGRDAPAYTSDPRTSATPSCYSNTQAQWARVDRGFGLLGLDADERSRNMLDA